MPFLTIARSSTAGRRGGPSSAGIAAPFESGSSLHSATRAELRQMSRQSGGRLRQFGAKESGLSKDGVHWHLGILEAPRFRGSWPWCWEKKWK